jgi:hypothetical protein
MLIMLVLAYWSGQTDLHCAACTWLNLSVAQTQCMHQDSQQTAATARLELGTCQSTSTLLMVSRSDK